MVCFFLSLSLHLHSDVHFEMGIVCEPNEWAVKILWFDRPNEIRMHFSAKYIYMSNKMNEIIYKIAALFTRTQNVFILLHWMCVGVRVFARESVAWFVIVSASHRSVCPAKCWIHCISVCILCVSVALNIQCVYKMYHFLFFWDGF